MGLFERAFAFLPKNKKWTTYDAIRFARVERAAVLEHASTTLIENIDINLLKQLADLERRGYDDFIGHVRDLPHKRKQRKAG